MPPSKREPERKAQSGSQPRRSSTNRRPVRRPNLDLPLPLGGRLWVVVALLAVMFVFPWTPLGNLFDPRAAVPEHDVWELGKSGKARITVITADYPQLQCASDQQFAGKHCEYKTQTERWSPAPDAPLDDNKRDIIQPYRTANDNQLLLVAGFWAQPDVAMRLHNEPASIPNEKLARFIVECDMDFIGAIDNPTLRWSSTATWNVEKQRTLVAVPKPNSCRVYGPDEDS